MPRFFLNLFRGFICLLTFVGAVHAETVHFNATDGLQITADLQKPDKKAEAAIVLFHMAGASRGEYKEIAKRLNRMGYITLAVDQRSGRQSNGIINETAKRAERKLGYQAAIPDLEAASAWARKNIDVDRIAVIGSSYSAALVLVLAGQDRQFADAVMSFSPGEYFSDRKLVRKNAKDIKVPVFITSARNETRQWKNFPKGISSPVVAFIPKGRGRHGASALVSKDASEYWSALDSFLSKYFQPS